MEFYSDKLLQGAERGFDKGHNAIPDLDIATLAEGEAFVPILTTLPNGNRVPATGSSIMRNGRPQVVRDENGQVVKDQFGNDVTALPKVQYAKVLVFTKNAAGKWEPLMVPDPTDLDESGNPRIKQAVKHLYPSSICHRIFQVMVEGPSIEPNEANLSQFNLNNITVATGLPLVRDKGSLTEFFQAKVNEGANEAFVALHDYLVDSTTGKPVRVGTYKKDKTRAYFRARFNPRPDQTKAEVDYQRIWEIEEIG